MNNKIIFLICFLLSTAFTQAQNYFGETKTIMTFGSLIKKLNTSNSKVSASRDKDNNVIINVDKPLLDVLIELADKIKNPNGGPDSFTDTGKSAKKQPAIPQEGAIGTLPKSAKKNDKNQPKKNEEVKETEPSIDAKIEKAQQEDNEVLTELKYLSFLVLNNSTAEYADVAAVFPKHFEYLDAINSQLLQYVQNREKNFTGQSNPSAFGGNFSFSESAIIYGITDWAIKRAKEELMDSYLDHWYEKLKQDEVISPLIPQSLKVYEAFKNDDALNLAKYGDKWKAAFQEDIRNIPIVFQDETYVQKVFDRIHLSSGPLSDELKPVIAGGDELVYNLYLKKHLVVQLSSMANRYNDESTASFPVFKRCVIMADLLTTICGEMKDNKYVPVTLDDIKKMDIESWKILFKLVVLRNTKSLTHVFSISTPSDLLNIILQNNATLPGQLSTLIQETVTIISTYQNILTNVPQAKDLSFDDVRKLFDLTTQLFDNISKYFALSGKDEIKKHLTDFQNNVRPFLNYLSEIGEGISTRQYGKVLDGAISIIRQIELQKTGGQIDSLNQTLSDLQLYGSFMVNILTAKSSDEVEAAIDELIPKGQYQLKGQKTFSISLSVYPGAFAGQENISKFQTDNNGNINYALPKVTSTNTSLSFYLPIGIDFNLGRETHKSTLAKRKYVSHSLFIQLFDLGAVLNYRLTGKSDTTEKSDPNITFKQLVSPGLDYMFHLPNSPIVVGGGVNYTPELRTVNQKGNSYQSNAFRYGVFFAVDVTALFLHVSKKDKVRKNAK